MSTPAAGAAGAATDTTAAAAAAAGAGDQTAAAAAGTPAAGAAAAAAATPKTDGQAGAGAGTATGTTGENPPAQTPEQKAAAAAAAGTQGAPATYELVVPDGGRFDQADLDAFVADARANGLTNEAAQAVLNQQVERLEAQSQRFLQECESHPEIGGAKLEAAQLHANKALDTFLPVSTPEGQAMRSLLAKTGYANHPAFVLAWARVGKAMAEDGPVKVPTTPAPAKRSAADVLFGDAK